MPYALAKKYNGFMDKRCIDFFVRYATTVFERYKDKGFTVIAIARELQVPVKYVGLGEGIDDLQPFDAQAFVEALI